MSNTPEKEQPYIFEKRVNKSFGAAKVVLGPDAVRRLMTVILDLPEVYSHPVGIVGSALSLIDSSKQLVIHTGVDGSARMDIKLEDKEERIGDKLQGYTLIDIKGALAAAVHDDLTGTVLELVQANWEKELTIQDAENISFHLEKLIKLIK